MKAPIARVLALLSLTPLVMAVPPVSMEEVASFPKEQVTGVTVSKSGRIFVNFPFWSDDHKISVAEVLPGGTTKPFPDEAWNRKDGALQERFASRACISTTRTRSGFSTRPRPKPRLCCRAVPS